LQIIKIYVQSVPRVGLQRQWLRCNATGW